MLICVRKLIQNIAGEHVSQEWLDIVSILINNLKAAGCLVVLGCFTGFADGVGKLVEEADIIRDPS